MKYVLGVLVFLFASQGNHATDDLLSENEPLRNGKKLYNGDNDYGYAEVRDGVFMFYWLYYAGGNKETAYDKPLIIWLQSDRFLPGSIVGNFMEIGPQDVNLDSRNYSWVNTRNVLFIDFPVGIGFSYTHNSSLLVKNDKEQANDLVELMKQFLNKYSKFETVPTHIFSQGFGAKIAPRLAYYLHNEMKADQIKMNLKSVGLGSSMVSPEQTIIAYPEFMYTMGFMDEDMYITALKNCELIAAACTKGNYSKANNIRAKTLFSFTDTHTFNMFNVVKKPLYNTLQLLQNLIYTTIREALSDVVPADIKTWMSEYRSNIMDDSMKPSTHFVEKLLNETNLTVLVFNGQLDSVTPILGAVNWVQNLQWYGAEQFLLAPRLTIQGYGNGKYKKYERFSFWWIYNAGHWVPSDNPEAMEHILNVTVDSSTENFTTNMFWKIDLPEKDIEEDTTENPENVSNATESQ